MEKKFPKTPQEARRQGNVYYFTGKPCKHGHVCERFTSSRACRQCIYENNRERTVKQDYWIDYGDEAYKERKRQYAKKYYQRTAHKRGRQKRRQLEKLSKVATSKGAIELRRIQLEAQLLSIDTGVKHEVDHIIPLVHDKVCGLHVRKNVQLLTRMQNRQKASRFNQDEQSRIQLELLKKKP